MNNPEIFGDGSSPVINKKNNIAPAEKPSISFHQLKSKYGNINKNVRNENDYQYEYEDLKEGDREYFHVPEENEEEPPLRLKNE